MRPARPPNVAPVLIEREIVDFDLSQPTLAGRDATKDRLDARQQLLEAERLGDVVVGAEMQALDPVGRRVASREEDDRRRHAVTAEPLDDLDPVDAGHGDVEDDEVGAGRHDLGERLATVGRGVDLEADEAQARRRPDR